MKQNESRNSSNNNNSRNNPISLSGQQIRSSSQEEGTSKRISVIAERDKSFYESEGFKRVERTANILTFGGGTPYEQRSWIGKYAYLRLIHAIIDDNDIKAAYLSRLNLPSGRMAIEQRNTPTALASNVWQMVADKWNDPLFMPVSSVKYS